VVTIKKTKLEWAGWILSGLIGVVLVMFSLIKFIQPGDYAENAAAAGMQAQHLTVLGVLLALCAATYSIPRTSLVGAILTTGYFGGAISVHFLANDPIANLLLPIFIPILAWLGLALRRPDFRKLTFSR